MLTLPFSHTRVILTIHYSSLSRQNLLSSHIDHRTTSSSLLSESDVAESNERRTNRRSTACNFSLTTKVLHEALSLPATCIIAYHPTIFKPLSSLSLSNPLQASLLRCAAAGISVYSPHTTLDAVQGGITDWLAEGLLGSGQGKVEILGDEKTGAGGQKQGGVGRIVRLEEKISMSVLQERIKKHLGLKHSAFNLTQLMSSQAATDHSVTDSVLRYSPSGA